jgi:hypothetical protein
MSSNDIFVRLRYLDAYPKTLEDFRIKTYGGAAGKHDMLPTQLFLNCRYFIGILYVKLRKPSRNAIMNYVFTTK